jgi:hypothetical protein
MFAEARGLVGWVREMFAEARGLVGWVREMFAEARGLVGLSLFVHLFCVAPCCCSRVLLRALRLLPRAASPLRLPSSPPEEI